MNRPESADPHHPGDAAWWSLCSSARCKCLDKGSDLCGSSWVLLGGAAGDDNSSSIPSNATSHSVLQPRINRGASNLVAITTGNGILSGHCQDAICGRVISAGSRVGDRFPRCGSGWPGWWHGGMVAARRTKLGSRGEKTRSVLRLLVSGY